MKCYEVLDKYVAIGPINIYLLDIAARTFIKVPEDDKDGSRSLVKTYGTTMTEELFRNLIPTHNIVLCEMKLEYLKEVKSLSGNPDKYKDKKEMDDKIKKMNAI